MSNITTTVRDWIPFASDLKSWMQDVDSGAQVANLHKFEVFAPSNSWFDGASWARFSSDHFEIPCIALSLHVLAIAAVKLVLERYGKNAIRDFPFYWNVGFCVFSLCGLIGCLPLLARTVMEKSLYFTICAPPHWYGNNWSGLFVMLFVYSNVAELLDTVLVLIEKKPLLALQWMRHTIRLIYSWHLYSTYSAPCIWFAVLCYCGKSLRHGYSAITLTRYRHFVIPSASCLPLALLAQFIVGMYVSSNLVYHQVRGDECHVDRWSGIIGLAICATCFGMFLKMFFDNYCSNERKSSPVSPRVPLVSLDSFCKASQKSLDDMSSYVRRPLFVGDECSSLSRSASALFDILRDLSEKSLENLSIHADDGEDGQ